MPYQLPSGREVNIDPNTQGNGIPSNLPGNVPGGYTPAYGGVPVIPDPIASQWQAIGGDLAALPNLFTMGNAYNLFNYDQRLGQVAGTPGFQGVLSNLAGQLPQDVVNQIAQRSAERGISTGGAPDSPNLNAAYLRSIGLNSLQQQQLGQEQYGNLLSRFQQAAPFDISSFLVSPEQQQAANAAANVSAAAPNPQAAAAEEERKLLEAIAAGKAAGGAGGPIGSGGLDISKILDAYRAAQAGNQPGVVTGHGPNQTVNRGTSTTSPITSARQYVDPGATGSNGPIVPDRGRPNDTIQNAFASPDLVDASTLGGVGIDPGLNAMLGGGGIWGHLRSNDFANYSGGGVGGVNSFTGPWNNPQGTVTNTYGQYTPAEWAQFGNPFTVPDLSYDNTFGGAFGGSHGGVDVNNYASGTPITSRNLYSGNQMATPQEIEMLLGLIPEMSGITPNDRSMFGDPITSGSLYGGSGGNPDTNFGFGTDTSLSSNGDILDFLDLYG